MPGTTVNLRVSVCTPIHIPIGSIMKVTGVPPLALEPNWQNAPGTLRGLNLTPNFSTRTGLTKHLVHTRSRRTVRLAGWSSLTTLGGWGELDDLQILQGGLVVVTWQAFLVGPRVIFWASQQDLPSAAWCLSFLHLKQAVDHCWGLIFAFGVFFFSRKGCHHPLTGQCLFWVSSSSSSVRTDVPAMESRRSTPGDADVVEFIREHIYETANQDLDVSLLC